MFKISFSNIFIMDANFAGLCENVNNFSEDGIFASDSCVIYRRKKIRVSWFIGKYGRCRARL